MPHLEFDFWHAKKHSWASDADGEVGRSIRLTDAASKGRSGRAIPINRDLHRALVAARLWSELDQHLMFGLGVALLRAKRVVAKLKSDNHDIQAGINIVLRALETPIRQIVENAGVEGSIVVSKVMESKSETYGFDAQDEDYKDLVQAGIIDPTKVVRTALQDAASVAGLLVTTEAMVAEMPKKESPMAMPPGGGMGGMDF